MSACETLYTETPLHGVDVLADTHERLPVEVRAGSMLLVLGRKDARRLARALKRAARASRDYLDDGGKPGARA